jgi:hypothetical protein
MVDRRPASALKITASTASWSAADTALWCYLFLPVLIFLPGFFVPEIGIPAAAIAATAALHWLRGREPARGGHDEQRRLLIDCALLALLAGSWAALCGAGHLFHANGTDWVPRFAVLRDLVTEPWPPRYGEGSDMPMLLRAPIGYYLPTALIAHMTSLANADFMLLMWTWMGVALFFCANMNGTRGQKLAGALLFAFASGLDVIGLLTRTGSLPWPGQHMEWWAAKMQYSSNTTLLFWVPNHALPGWIAAAWLWRFRENSRFLARLPILFLPVMVWSPLTALGLLPIAFAVIAARWRACLLVRPERRQMLLSAGLVLVPGGLGAAYLLLGMGAGEPGLAAMPTSASAESLASLIGDRMIFFVLEAGIFAVFALMLERSAPVIASIAVLAVLPWLNFGPNNDLIMRASIPALTILWLRLITELTAEAAEQSLSRYPRAVLLALFLVGTVTPYQEIYRALSGNVWAADTSLSAPMALGGFPPHYFVPEKYNWLAPWMRR